MPSFSIRKQVVNRVYYSESGIVPNTTRENTETPTFIKGVKKGIYTTLNFDPHIDGYDKKLGQQENFCKGAIDGLFELPEFLECIEKDPGIILRILKSIGEVNWKECLKDLINTEDSYKTGRTSVNWLLSLLGLGALIKSTARIAAVIQNKVNRNISKQIKATISKDAILVGGDTWIIGEKTDKLFRAMTTGKARAAALTGPRLKAVTTFGIDPLRDMIFKGMKNFPKLGKVLGKYESAINTLIDYTKKYPRAKDTLIVGVALSKIEKELSQSIDRIRAQQSIAPTDQLSGIELNSAVLLEKNIITILTSLPVEVVKKIFK